jgi:hypothetical protein
VTRLRVTQIMNLLHLAPDIQEEILFLTEVFDGRDPIFELDVRPIAAEFDWRKQRQAFSRLAPRLRVPKKWTFEKMARRHRTNLTFP